MTRLALLLSLASAAALSTAAPTAAELAKAVREAGLDAKECYRVRDFSFAKDDIKVYLTEGYLIFSNPVNGRRLSAVFTADVEGGDGEIILIPPNRSERQSLAAYTQSPNLDEHLRSAFMVFTDGTADELFDQIRKEAAARRMPEIGATLAQEWSPVANNIASTMQMRLVEDLLGPPTPEAGLVFLALSGKTLGNFDVILDGRLQRRIAVQKRSEKPNRSAFEVWTSFPAKSVRNGRAAPAPPEYSPVHYQIDAAIDPALRVRAVTKVTLRTGPRPLRAFPFFVSRAMQVRSARIDGAPAELLTGEYGRSRIAGMEEETPLLVIAVSDLAPGSEHQFEFEHEGNVITTAGDNVYFVQARSSWYPHAPSGAATYDLLFRYPKNLMLVTSGAPVQDRIEGDVKITSRRISVPVASAGFNLGEYEKISGTAAGISIDVYGNRHVQESLQPRAVVVPPMPDVGARRGRGPFPGRMPEPIAIVPAAPDPLARLRALAADMTSSIEFFAGLYGPPALKNVTVAPIPGTFGQGFPGLVYMSTIAYLDPRERPGALRNANEETFYSDLIAPHEAAHQWWGGVVTVDRSEDGWIIEALANYSALMWVEKKKGTRELQQILENYRDELLSAEHGEPAESAGPIVWGSRLEAGGNPDAWRIITYAKGAWILHMLRKRMGDGRFIAMLRELRKRYEFKPVTTENFRALAIEFRPAGMSEEVIASFFDNWVYATGVPSLKVKFSAKGIPPAVSISGTVEQTGVDEDFSVDVPVELQQARGPSQTVWVRSSTGEESFSAKSRFVPVRAVISSDILMRK